MSDKAEMQAARDEMIEKATCQLCGEPMPKGEEAFNYHGYSGSCPKPPKSNSVEIGTISNQINTKINSAFPQKKTVDAAYKFLAKLKRDRYTDKSPKISPAVMAEFADEWAAKMVAERDSKVTEPERVKVQFNGGRIYDVPLGDALQEMANVADRFANEADDLRRQLKERDSKVIAEFIERVEKKVGLGFVQRGGIFELMREVAKEMSPPSGEVCE